jgi:hypothetical protein
MTAAATVQPEDGVYVAGTGFSLIPAASDFS